MAGHGRNAGEDQNGAAGHDNVVRFPGGWAGAIDELVPLGRAAAGAGGGTGADATVAPAADRTPGGTPTGPAMTATDQAAVDPDDFWGEQSDLLHQPYAAPVGEVVPGGRRSPLRRVAAGIAALVLVLGAATTVLLGSGSGDRQSAGATADRVATAAPLAATLGDRPRVGGAIDSHRPKAVRSRRARDGTSKARTRTFGARSPDAAAAAGSTPGVPSSTAGSAGAQGSVPGSSAGSSGTGGGSAPYAGSSAGTGGGQATSSQSAAGGSLASGGLPGPGAVNPAAP